MARPAVRLVLATSSLLLLWLPRLSQALRTSDRMDSSRRLSRSPLSLAAAEQVFNSEVQRALQASVASLGGGPGALTTPFCVQMVVDLSQYMPSLTMNLGLVGDWLVDAETGCLGGDFQASFTFKARVQVLEHVIRARVTAAGPVGLAGASSPEEAKPTGNRSTPAADQAARANKCHAESPWPALQTLWENKAREIFGSEQMRRMVRAEAERTTDLTKLRILYRWMLKDVGPRFGPPAHAVLTAAGHFFRLVPGYAAQVMSRLYDNHNWKIGCDNERTWPVSGVMRRFQTADGRFLARWPSREMLASVQAEAGRAIEVEGKVKDSDMRVLNFAKVMRISRRTGSTSFWKELAMSAGNLMVRVVSDVKALFATLLAGSPHWDGNCEALPRFFPSTGVDWVMLMKLEGYPWAGQSSKNSKRVSKFAKQTASMTEDVLPHMWCRLAEQASEGPEGAMVRNLLGGGNVLELSVAQACETVVHEFRDLEEDDQIVRDESTRRYDVRRGGEKVGMLYESDFFPVESREDLLVKSPRKRMKQGYRVATKAVESRPECERAEIPLPFAVLFPGFTHAAAEAVTQLEALLLEINVCLDEVGHSEGVAGSVVRTMPSPLEDEQGEVDLTQSCYRLDRTEKLAYVRKRAVDAVRIVRYALLRLGAGDPREQDGFKESPFLSEDDSEKELLSEIGRVGKAPLASALESDFNNALGVGDHSMGHLWHGVRSLKDWIQKFPDPFRRMRHDTEQMHPAVELPEDMAVTGSEAPADLCRANPAS